MIDNTIKMIDGYKYLVRVNCMTFNQSSYIEDAMNGFCMQETSFPFVCVIMDDASTDGEPEVIKNYLQQHFNLDDETIVIKDESDDCIRIFAQHVANKNCYFAVVLLKCNHYSIKKPRRPYVDDDWYNTKYIAFCEGDDYWTDPLKLQMQVDFLEEHKDYSLCCHRYKVYNQNEETWEDDYVKKLFEEAPDGFSFSNKENLNTWITKTLTLMYRRDCYDSSESVKYKYRCDEHMNYHLLKKGIGYCFPFVGGVYRRCNTGVFSALSEKEKVKRWCLLRAEMLNYNLGDKVLRDDVFLGAKKHLISHEVCKEMVKVVVVCLKSFYYTEGLKAMFVSLKKMMGAFVKGLWK